MAAKVSAPLSTSSEQPAITSPAGVCTSVACQALVDDASVLPQSGYLTAAWVKRRYSISNSTLYKWIADSRHGGGNGFPSPVHIGPRAVRWSAKSLRQFEAALMEDGR